MAHSPTPADRVPPSHRIDNRIYTDPALFAAEQDRIFGGGWQFVAHVSEVRAPGDFVTTRVGKTPVVLVRATDDSLRAFVNVCPHRGAMVVREPAGNAAAFKCLFHHWSFSTDGRCLAIPQASGYETSGLSPADFGLTGLRVAEYVGLVFVSVEHAVAPLADYLAGALDGVADVLASRPLEVFHYHRIELETNWKLWAATNVELYHVWLHSLNRASSLRSRSWLERRLIPYPNGHVAFAPAQHEYRETELDDRSLTLPGLAPNEARIAHVFPDLLVNVRASCVRLDRLTPLAPDRLLVECRGLGIAGEPPEDRRRRRNEHNQFWGPFGRNVPEDGLATVAQMRALASDELGYSIAARDEADAPATSDEPLRHFQAEWARRVGWSEAGLT